MMVYSKHGKKIVSGFTLIEILVVIAILFILAVIVVLALRPFGQKTHLGNSVENIVNVLRLAQSRTLASDGASSYGAYFDQVADPHSYVLFKGDSYALRDEDFDNTFNLSSFIEISDIDLVDGTEVVFDRIVGTTAHPGSITLRLKSDASQAQTIYVDDSGIVGLVGISIPAGGRTTDSRHVHLDYKRNINTASEEIVLTFEGGITQNINVADNLKDGQIYWSGVVDVDGQDQTIKIHTHELNNPDTIFSIHRDRRHNDKSLTITISGDATGYLINYSADGLTVTKESIFASDPVWQ